MQVMFLMFELNLKAALISIFTLTMDQIICDVKGPPGGTIPERFLIQHCQPALVPKQLNRSIARIFKIT